MSVSRPNRSTGGGEDCCVAHKAETPKPVDGAHVGAAAPVGWEGGGRGSGGNDKDAIKACVNEMTAAGWPVQERRSRRAVPSAHNEERVAPPDARAAHRVACRRHR